MKGFFKNKVNTSLTKSKLHYIVVANKVFYVFDFSDVEYNQHITVSNFFFSESLMK